MHDPLNAIRRLYGAPGDAAPEELAPEEQAEFEAMADLKAALDRLPPRSPDPAVVDAVVAASGEAVRAAALGPVRAVYGEGDEDLDSAEARALAEVKAGLDALPSHRPDPSLIDAVVAAAGEASRAAALAPIRAAYDEDAAPLTAAAEAEAAALASVKDALDQMPPRRPDPAVIDAVVAAAFDASAQPAAVAATTTRAADRPARRSETRRRVAGALAAVFAVVVVFAGGLWLNQNDPSAQQIAEADRAEAGAPSAEEQIAGAAPPLASGEAEAVAPPAADLAASPAGDAASPAGEASADEGLVAAAAPPPAPRPLSEPAAARSAPSVAPDADAALARRAFADATSAAGVSADDVRLANAEALAQDSDDELRLLYLRLREMQDAQAGLGWDTPPVALGAPPDSIPAPTETGWMQVRVQR